MHLFKHSLTNSVRIFPPHTLSLLPSLTSLSPTGPDRPPLSFSDITPRKDISQGWPKAGTQRSFWRLNVIFILLFLAKSCFFGCFYLLYKRMMMMITSRRTATRVIFWQ